MDGGPIISWHPQGYLATSNAHLELHTTFSFKNSLLFADYLGIVCHHLHLDSLARL
jgi:hypothetical protein